MNGDLPEAPRELETLRVPHCTIIRGTQDGIEVIEPGKEPYIIAGPLKQIVIGIKE